VEKAHKFRLISSNKHCFLISYAYNCHSAITGRVDISMSSDRAIVPISNSRSKDLYKSLVGEKQTV
jgi:hypothetical protein